ncbi:MAG: hypothetical protein LBT88_03450 [Oscillospiraceae bacterium]|jgi:acetyl-CoA carboxylase biotin carboxyl carrier protein|nr:hypothetical protein [Oscillospiraceae bacterium]
MNFSNIKQLAALMAEHNLSSLSYEDGEFKLSLSKSPAEAVSASPLNTPDAIAPNEDGLNLVSVTAPVVGTVYRAREPGNPPLVSVGDAVNQGDALCIIEAMKVFSEITAPCAGKVVEIAFSDGALAEFGAKLVVIEPAETGE